MKKIALCSLLVGLCAVNCWANCGYEVVRDKSASDEDIFFSSTRPDYKDGVPKAIICGKQQSMQFCEDKTWIYVVAEHYNTTYGKGINKIYSCDESVINHNWGLRYASELKQLRKCPDDTPGYVRVDIPGYDDGKLIFGLPIESGKAFVNLCWKECKDCNETVVENVVDECPDGTERATKDIDGISSCTGDKCELIKAGECIDRKFLRCMEAVANNLKVVWNVQRCICTDDGKEFDYETRSCAGGGNNAGTTCEQLYPNGSAERLACCRAGKETSWTGTATSGTCKCVDETKKWTYTAGARTGQCVAKEQKQEQQNEEPCYYNYTGYIRCPNGNFSLTMKQYKLEKSDLEGKSCDEFKRLYENDVNASETLRAKICAEKQSAVVVTVPVGPSETQIKDARDTLKTFAANAESNASGWKTAEGKFNTTRLASDLTAGVVLGTVGGVVSGVVIKKKQVEKGFDALHCTVGGQKIADWGDTFTVGLQR